MKSIELKIKLKHLAAESRINRREAEKQYALGNYSKGNDITNHRKLAIRPEARATHLAYQYLRGIPYSRIENSPKTKPKWDRVRAMVRKYGDTDDPDLKSWRQGLDQSTEAEVAA